MLPATIPHQLPQANLLWSKLKDDLQSGFRVKGKHPSYTEIIRVWTKVENFESGHANKFLIIATAKQGLGNPVGSLEIHAYSESEHSWKLSLIQHPFPEPHWKHVWETKKSTYPVESTDSYTQQLVISSYLQSVFDHETTHESFTVTKSNMEEERVVWIEDSS